MPIPFLLGALVAGAAAIGVGGHIMAASDNSKAKSLIADAQYMYDNAKKSLEQARESAANALFSLGKGKKKVLDTSMSQFLRSYEHVKPISMRLTTGINELDVFAVDEQAELHIREMTNIYDNAFKGAAAGAATGALVTLGAMGAAGVAGAAGIAGSGLATAGGLLIAGEVGAAATAAGSALTAGAVLTPLAAVAAPVVMFTGISAAINADENLDKAKATYAEAETAVERMRVAETICHGIEERSQMFQNLMNELNAMFVECTGKMEPLVEKKRSGFLFFKKQIKSEDLSTDEIQLLAVTRSLAGAIKAVLDTPIMTSEGHVDDNSRVVYENTVQSLPVIQQQVDYIRSVDYSVNPVKATENSNSNVHAGTILKWVALLVLVGAGWYFLSSSGAKQEINKPVIEQQQSTPPPVTSSPSAQQGITADLEKNEPVVEKQQTLPQSSTSTQSTQPGKKSEPVVEKQQTLTQSTTSTQQRMVSDLTLAGISIGNPTDTVFQNLGKPVKQEKKNSNMICYYYPSVEVYCQAGQVVALISNSPQAQTTKGIHEGSPLADVFSLYGDNYMKFQYNNEEIYEYETGTNDGAICLFRFAIKNGSVDYISIRRRD